MAKRRARSQSVYDAPPSSMMDSTASPKVKTSEEGVGVHSLARSTLGGLRGVGQFDFQPFFWP